MMKIFRRRLIRVPVTVALVILHMGVFVPRQAQAALPLAVIAPVMLGTAMMVQAGATYYAPAIYSAGSQAANQAGQVAHEAIRVGKTTIAAGTAHATDYLWGKGVSAYTAAGAAVTAFWDYVKAHASQVPALYQALMDHTQAGNPLAPGLVTPSKPPEIPIGSIVQTSYNSSISAYPNQIAATSTRQVTGPWTTTIAKYCPPEEYAYDMSGLTLLGSSVAYYFPGSHTCVYAGRIPVNYHSAPSASSSGTLTEWPDGGIDFPALSPVINNGGQPMADDITKVFDAIPNHLSLANESITAALDATTQKTPPAPWLPSEVSSFVTSANINWPLSQPLPALGQNVSNPPLALPGEQTIALPVTVVNPNNGSPPIIHAGNPTQIVSTSTTTVNEQGQIVEEPYVEPIEEEVPYNPAAIPGPYTLPDVDFGARWEQFISTVGDSPLFSLPSQIGSIPGGGTSTITLNMGTTFGTHVFDFANFAQAWLILNGIFTIAFGWVSIRIITLKR